ncbi:MAG TPA: amidase [Anaeromyxobacteraceae bacterium]|nr:amidase [Anaeromyxobacteraceae bacterium]
MSLLPDDVLFGGVAALGEKLRARELSPVDLTQSCLARLQRLGPRLGCVVTVTAERALAQAKVAEQELQAGAWRGPLHGIPYGLKDLLDTKGIPTTWGARPFAGRVPAEDATLVQRLDAAGAVLCAKLAMVELAGGLGYHTGEASLTGACRTPWDLARWSGGSSSGSAAAVAAGLVPFAIGSETWGSITCPAAFCGVTGLRPTYGVLSRAGAMALSYTLDKLGPIARSAQDCALVLGALAGEDVRDPSSVPPPPALARVRPEVPRGLRVAVLGFEGITGVDPAARDAFAAARALFREAGALLEEAKLPELPYEPLATLFIEAEAATAFEELIRTGKTRELADASHATRKPEDYQPKATAADYVRAMRVRGEVQRRLAAFFERYDLVLAPNLPVAPPPVASNFDALFDFPDPLGAAGNVAGLPALALPMGFVNGLPVSLQLVGPPLSEARLLSAGALFQARTGFHQPRPPL